MHHSSEMRRIFVLGWLLAFALGACHNGCSGGGKCLYSDCECFPGFEGNACEKRSCPVGPQLRGMPFSDNEAHPLAECSGQGVCDYRSGNCRCEAGYAGYNCGKTKCHNDCSGKGQCLSLKSAAAEYDGYLYNRTTVYSQWDAEMFFGCKCEYGFSGVDCSERVCPSGVDPRLSTQNTETVTLLCDCTGIGYCGGKFKMRFLGQQATKWLTTTSTVDDLARSLTTIPGVYKNNHLTAFTSINATSNSQYRLICENGRVTRTSISFRRNHGDLPSLSFYGKAMNFGKLYFETVQTLVCDLINTQGNGTIRLSFDGEMSSRLSIWSMGSDLSNAIRKMATVQSAQLTVVDSEDTPLCKDGSKENHTIVFKGDIGNVPRLALWSSVQRTVVSYQSLYSSDNNTKVLTLETNDGRDDNVKICNGIGKCNFATGSCTCPYGWGFDADIGPCGRMTPSSSDWNGLARCPGVIPKNFDTLADGLSDLSGTQNYVSRLYMSVNPIVGNLSGIYYFPWRPTQEKFSLAEESRVHFISLSSNASAGPLALDNAKLQMFFVDANPYTGTRIGVASTLPGAYENLNGLDYDYSAHSVYLRVAYKIYGFTFDAHPNRRRLYWTSPNDFSIANGAIYYSEVDVYPHAAVSLTAAIGQANLINPLGIAIHQFENGRIYWVDRDTTLKNSVLNSCEGDGSGFTQRYIYRKEFDNHTVSSNLSDIVIDFVHNNTVFFGDGGVIPAIIATNLDAPIYYNNNSGDDQQFEEYTEARVVVTSASIGKPRYLMVDTDIDIVFWSDPTEKNIGYARYKTKTFTDTNKEGVVYAFASRDYAVGILLDRGYGPPTFASFLDCYGNGVCTGVEGNFACECNKGYFGDCSAATCPTGPAWYHEPAVDQVAHDEQVECSNAGQCDRSTGKCACVEGFEGTACERLSCGGDGECSNRGRCMSLKNMATYHKASDGTAAPLTYGSHPYDKATWDAEHVQGCVADDYGYFQVSDSGIPSLTFFPGYNGTGLETVACPVGFDRRMLDGNYKGNYSGNITQYKEIQNIYCKAFQGEFVLEFRGQKTGTMFWNVSKADLKTGLEGIPLLGAVTVEFTDATVDVLCDDAVGQTAIVTFENALGEVPLLAVASSTLYGVGIRISRAQAGSTAFLKECAGYGDCDYATGACRCWDNYATSDGFGNPGTRGDCGYLTTS